MMDTRTLLVNTLYNMRLNEPVVVMRAAPSRSMGVSVNPRRGRCHRYCTHLTCLLLSVSPFRLPSTSTLSHPDSVSASLEAELTARAAVLGRPNCQAP